MQSDRTGGRGKSRHSTRSGKKPGVRRSPAFRLVSQNRCSITPLVVGIAPTKPDVSVKPMRAFLEENEGNVKYTV